MKCTGLGYFVVLFVLKIAGVNVGIHVVNNPLTNVLHNVSV